jgi:hypothetical protein
MDKKTRRQIATTLRIAASTVEGMSSIKGLDHTGKVNTYRVGDAVLVFPDMGPGGRHPNGQGFEDRIRSVFEQTDTLGKTFPAVVLTKVSWVPLTAIEPA